MGLKVGSARIDERGKITGGQAGDSTGKEVMQQNYYMDSRGWYCFRAKDINTANGIAQSMIDACNNNNIGYDQNQRDGVFNLVKKGTKIKNIKTKTECDCSALVRACCYENGIDTGNIRTATMPKLLDKTGKFEKKISVTSKTELFNGDILVTKTTGHTVIVTSGNPRKKTNTKKSLEIIAKEVIDGKWDTGDTRKEKLEKAGYSYKEVQAKANELLKAKTTTKPSVSYYPKCTSNHTSIVSALNSIGVKSSITYRAKIAKKNNIKLYVGTSSQNIKMLDLLKKGKLIKV